MTCTFFAGAKTGKDNGFSVLFDIESYDYGYYDEGSEGLKVAIVHHLVRRRRDWQGDHTGRIIAIF
jgi:hypothetical protein